MAPTALQPSAGLQPIGYEKLHDLAHSNRPPGALKKASNTWIAILLHSIRQPKEIKARNSFVWIKCHPKITLRTIEHEYFMRHPLEDFRLYYDGTGDFPPLTAEVRILRYHDPLNNTYANVRAMAKGDQVEHATNNLPGDAGSGEAEGGTETTAAKVPAHPGKAASHEPVIIVLRALEQADVEAVNRANYRKRKYFEGKGTDIGNAITLDSEDEDTEEEADDSVTSVEEENDAATLPMKRKLDKMHDGVDEMQHAAQVHGGDDHEEMADEEPAYTPNWQPFIDRFGALPAEAQNRVNADKGLSFCENCGKQMYYKPWTRFGPNNGALCTNCTKVDLHDLDEQVDLAEVEGWIEEEFAEKHVRRMRYGVPQNMDQDAKLDFDAELGNVHDPGSCQAVWDQLATARAAAVPEDGHADEDDADDEEEEEDRHSVEEVQPRSAEEEASDHDGSSVNSASEAEFEAEDDDMVHSDANAPEPDEEDDEMIHPNANVSESDEEDDDTTNPDAVAQVNTNETTMTHRVNRIERWPTPFPEDASRSVSASEEDEDDQMPHSNVHTPENTNGASATPRLNHFNRSSTRITDVASDPGQKQLSNSAPSYTSAVTVNKPPTPPTSENPVADLDEAVISASSAGSVTDEEDDEEDDEEEEDEDEDDDAAASEASFATPNPDNDDVGASPAGPPKTGSRWSTLGQSVRGWFGRSSTVANLGSGSGSGASGSSDEDGAAEGKPKEKHVQFAEGGREQMEDMDEDEDEDVNMDEDMKN